MRRYSQRVGSRREIVQREDKDEEIKSERREARREIVQRED